MTNKNYPGSFARGSLFISIAEVPEAPLLAPSGQLLRFSESAVVNSVSSGPGIAVTLHNGPGSVFFAPPRFALIPPPAAAGTVGCGSTLVPGTALPTVTGGAGGAPLFSMNASSGALKLIALPIPAVNWATQPSYAAAGAVVRAAYSLCANVSNAFGVWSAGYVVAGIVSTSSQAIISGYFVQGANNITLYGGSDGLTPVMDTVGGGTVFFTGSGFGLANASTAGTAFTATYGSVALGLNYSAACTVAADNVLLGCTPSAGVGSRLSW